jgi:heat shock protein HslJ
MTRWTVVALLALLPWPVLAQPAQIFPIGQSFRAMSISGFDVQNKGLSLVITRTAGDYKGSGNAGCNTWNAMVILRDREIDFVGIVSTKKKCGKAEMDAEDAFFTSLRQVKRWHFERDNLVVQGDAAELRLKPGLARFKPEKATKKKTR